MMSIGLSAALSLSLLTACGGNNSAGNSGEKQVVIYSNADEGGGHRHEERLGRQRL